MSTSKTRQAGRAGKYDAICERLSLDLKAASVVLIVVDGRHGSGMSVSFGPQPTALATERGRLAWLLRDVADQLDAGAGPDGVRQSVIFGGDEQ